MLYNGGEDKMLVKNAENRGQLEFVSLESMVPQDHLLRRSMCSAGGMKAAAEEECLDTEAIFVDGTPSVENILRYIP